MVTVLTEVYPLVLIYISIYITGTHLLHSKFTLVIVIFVQIIFPFYFQSFPGPLQNSRSSLTIFQLPRLLLLYTNSQPNKITAVTIILIKLAHWLPRHFVNSPLLHYYPLNVKKGWQKKKREL